MAVLNILFTCHPGYYCLDEEEKKRALEFLKEVYGAVVPAPMTKDSLELPDSESSQNNANIIKYFIYLFFPYG